MRLYLVRHGETAHNRDGLGLGRHDAPLNDLGRRQAACVGDRLRNVAIDAAYASPLSRALQTAEIALGGRVPVVPHDGLLELDVGVTEGVPLSELQERFPEFLEQWRRDDGHLARMPGGESLADLDLRVAAFLEAITASVHDGVLVVSHNFVVRALVCRLLGIGIAGFRSFTTDLASITTVDITTARTTLVTLNDTCHLDALEP